MCARVYRCIPAKERGERGGGHHSFSTETHNDCLLAHVNGHHVASVFWASLALAHDLSLSVSVAAIGKRKVARYACYETVISCERQCMYLIRDWRRRPKTRSFGRQGMIT